jgi:glucosamine--fructose-6-phosphate aminotransferase (isomerizing)
MFAGAKVPRVITLPTAAADPVLEPMLIVQSFYRMVNALALARGHNPDEPPYLHKVTETV